VTAIGAEKLDLLAPKFLVVTIKLGFALRAGHPENFRHDSSWCQRKKIQNPNIEIRNPGNFSKSIFTTETLVVRKNPQDHHSSIYIGAYSNAGQEPDY
jgi:hypothetical protein